MPEDFDEYILVVEDDADMAFLISRLLAGLAPGYKIVHLLDGHEAMGRLQLPPKPVLVITDLDMPRVTGLELLEWIRQQPQARYPVVVFSGTDNTHDKTRCEELGVDGFVEKNGGLSRLSDLCQELLNLKLASAKGR